MIKNSIIIALLVMSGVAGLSLSLYLHKKPQENTQEIQTFHYPALLVKQLQHDPLAGEKIFKEFCSSCHDQNPVIDVNAPRIHDEKAWRVRRKWGMPQLLKMTVSGVGAMPARGGCFECSDDQLRQAIEYMIHQ